MFEWFFLRLLVYMSDIFWLMKTFRRQSWGNQAWVNRFLMCAITCVRWFILHANSFPYTSLRNIGPGNYCNGYYGQYSYRNVFIFIFIYIYNFSKLLLHSYSLSSMLSSVYDAIVALLFLFFPYLINDYNYRRKIFYSLIYNANNKKLYFTFLLCNHQTLNFPEHIFSLGLLHCLLCWLNR